MSCSPQATETPPELADVLRSVTQRAGPQLRQLPDRTAEVILLRVLFAEDMHGALVANWKLLEPDFRHQLLEAIDRLDLPLIRCELYREGCKQLRQIEPSMTWPDSDIPDGYMCDQLHPAPSDESGVTRITPTCAADFGLQHLDRCSQNHDGLIEQPEFWIYLHRACRGLLVEWPAESNRATVVCSYSAATDHQDEEQLIAEAVSRVTFVAAQLNKFPQVALWDDTAFQLLSCCPVGDEHATAHLTEAFRLDRDATTRGIAAYAGYCCHLSHSFDHQTRIQDLLLMSPEELYQTGDAFREKYQQRQASEFTRRAARMERQLAQLGSDSDSDSGDYLDSDYDEHTPENPYDDQCDLICESTVGDITADSSGLVCSQKEARELVERLSEVGDQHLCEWICCDENLFALWREGSDDTSLGNMVIECMNRRVMWDRIHL